jgi:hypothetical protein
MSKYPKDFMTGELDEEYKASLEEVNQSLKNMRTNFSGYNNSDDAIDKVVNKLWDDQMEDMQDINKD